MDYQKLLRALPKINGVSPFSLLVIGVKTMAKFTELGKANINEY